jgi:hypothetical protein
MILIYVQGTLVRVSPDDDDNNDDDDINLHPGNLGSNLPKGIRTC